MRKKMGWTVYGILGFIFAPMGFLFLMIGLVVEEAIYQKESAEIHLKAEVKENESHVNQSDADAAEAMKKLATNPELMQLLIKLSKSM